MGRIIFDTAVSINGWIADEDNSLEWLFAVEGAAEPEADFGLPTDAAVMVEGSVTYEWMLTHDNLLEQPHRWQELFADKVTFVFTTRDLPVPQGADVRFVRGAVTDALPTIREAAGGGDIWVVGGGDLVGQFLDADALDVFAVSIAPVALTGGAPLLPRRIEAGRLRLTEARAIGQFVRAVYEVNQAE